MTPVLLSTPEPMSRVRIITLKDYTDQTLKVLHKMGVLHVETGEELAPPELVTLELQRSRITELLSSADEVLGYLPDREKISLERGAEVLYLRPFRELEDEANLLFSSLINQNQKIVQRRRLLRQLSELETYLVPFPQQTSLKLKDLNFLGKYLFSCVVIVPNESYEAIRDRLESCLFRSAPITIHDETVIYAIGRTEDRGTVESLVDEAEGRILKIPDEDLTLEQFLRETASRVCQLEDEVTNLEREFRSQFREKLEQLVLTRAALVAESERLSVLEKAREAKYITLVEGWIPEESVTPAIAELRDNIEYLSVDTREPAANEEVPTKQKNLRAVKPFQVITNLFSIPKYGEWDPTPVIAYSFALFFGLMMGDVIYALGALLLARFLLPMLVDDPGTESFNLFQRILYISGGVALIVGLLSGTYLGDFLSKFLGVKSLAFVGVVEKIMQTPISFIVVAIVIGFVHVNVGHVLGLINGAKKGNKGTVIGKIGLFLLQLSALPYIISILSIELPFLNEQVFSIVRYTLLLSIVLIVLASVIERGKFLGSIFWLFDITGILGDIMSYARIAGVGLATFYLAFCFNLIAGLFPQMLPGAIGAIIGTIAAVIVLFIGHAINLILGMLTGFIHSLRLCFVEFLFKFYEGGGREYSPFKLRTRTSMIAGART